MPEVTETPDYKIWLGDDGILYLTWKPGVNMTLDLVRQASDHIRSITKGKVYPMLVGIEGIKGMDRDAREFILNQKDYSAAAVIGVSPVARVIGNMAIGFVKKASVPSRMFSSEEEALEWLEGFKTVVPLRKANSSQ